MKKINKTDLRLDREVIASLSESDLLSIKGGNVETKVTICTCSNTCTNIKTCESIKGIPCVRLSHDCAKTEIDCFEMYLSELGGDTCACFQDCLEKCNP